MWVKNQRNSWHGVDFPYHSDLDVRDYKKQYNRALAAVDESLGTIMQFLEEKGIAENTIIMFMGDNGFMFGEHGLIDKRNAYEASMRVPLLAYAPGVFAKGHVVEDMVANIDIAPTILDMLNVAQGDDMQGESFFPQLQGESVSDWRNEIMYEYFWEWVFPQTPTTYALRTDKFKLIQYHGIWDTDELYDLENDPDEMNNLIGEAQYKAVARSMRERLYEFITSGGGEAVVPFTRKQGPGLHYRNPKGADAAVFPESVMRTGDEDDIEAYKD